MTILLLIVRYRLSNITVRLLDESPYFPKTTLPEWDAVRFLAKCAPRQPKDRSAR